MIIFNSLEEANKFKDWVNINCPILPLITYEPVESNNNFFFESTEELDNLYQQYNANQLH